MLRDTGGGRKRRIEKKERQKHKKKDERRGGWQKHNKLLLIGVFNPLLVYQPVGNFCLPNFLSFSPSFPLSLTEYTECMCNSGYSSICCVYRANDCISLTWLWLWASLPLLCVNNYLQTFSHQKILLYTCIFVYSHPLEISIFHQLATRRQLFFSKAVCCNSLKNSGT